MIAHRYEGRNQEVPLLTLFSNLRKNILLFMIMIVLSIIRITTIVIISIAMISMNDWMTKIKTRYAKLWFGEVWYDSVSRLAWFGFLFITW